MKYNDEDAQRIAAEHNVSPATVKTWRHRDNIPERYFREKYSKVESLTAEQVTQAEKLLGFVLQPAINASAFDGLMSYPKKIDDIKKGKTRFTQEELTAISARREELAKEIKRLCKTPVISPNFETELKKLLSRPEIKVKSLLDQAGITDSQHHQVIAFLYEKRNSVDNPDVHNAIKSQLLTIIR